MSKGKPRRSSRIRRQSFLAMRPLRVAMTSTFPVSTGPSPGGYAPSSTSDSLTRSVSSPVSSEKAHARVTTQSGTKAIRIHTSVLAQLAEGQAAQGVCFPEPHQPINRSAGSDRVPLPERNEFGHVPIVLGDDEFVRLLELAAEVPPDAFVHRMHQLLTRVEMPRSMKAAKYRTYPDHSIGALRSPPRNSLSTPS